jgi:glyoxylase-like metal-dependent hydrolase (beta-lactamase superfamily II)
MSLSVQGITFNPFQENTYIIAGPSGDCILIDPGCFDSIERNELKTYIANHSLRPVRLINTHCHIDHILGNAFVANTWNLGLEIHKGELPVLESGTTVAGMYGIPYETSPLPASFIKEGDEITLEGYVLKVLFTPGHSPASICLYHEAGGWLIGGDVLFYESIGRTDLPGGNHELLLKSIREQLFVLPKDTIVYPGHVQETTVGYEKMFNPWLK